MSGVVRFGWNFLQTSGAAAAPARFGRLRGGATGIFALLAVLAPPLSAADPEIVTYATECFKRLGLTENMIQKEYSCKSPAPSGELYQLFMTIDGVIQDININQDRPCTKAPCASKPNPNPAPHIPLMCDRPAWLELGDSKNGGCYGNSYLQVLKFKNPDVKAALLCRHKKKWTDEDKFPDVAMIFHNSSNG